MDSFIKADIFFVIASIATITLTILLSILLYYFIKSGRNLYLLSESLKSNFKESEDFILDLKNRLENNIVFKLFFPLNRKRKKLLSKDED